MAASTKSKDMVFLLGYSPMLELVERHSHPKGHREKHNDTSNEPKISHIRLLRIGKCCYGDLIWNGVKKM